MEFDLSWLLLGLPAAFALGWMASRLDFRQLRIENRLAPKSYFKGLNFLLNEQQDEAIDAFIEAVQIDPDTSELHFALGNLFRRRGEYERAVRVHEHLLERSDLSQADQHRAQHALALDFLKAGLLDRAEVALQKLDCTAFEARSRLALLAIYERSRDWSKASAIAEKLQSSGQGDFSGRLSHYFCEQAQQATTPAEPIALARTRDLLQQALETAPAAPRPRLALASLMRAQGDNNAAFDTLLALSEAAPAAMPLVAAELVQTAQATRREAQALQVLQASYRQIASLDVLDAIAALSSTHEGAQAYLLHLQREASLVAAVACIERDPTLMNHLPAPVLRALAHAVKPLKRYRCAACGFEAQQHFWQCPGCQAWDSYPARRVEEL
ncbi:MAG: lipopolysaccharide assembly protein LapB [Burkholderiaceae bacterium]